MLTNQVKHINSYIPELALELARRTCGGGVGAGAILCVYGCL